MNKSFTLIELLVVISILGLLSGIVLIGLQGAKDRARISEAQEFSHIVRVSLGADLIGEWRFDNNINDSSGSNNHGVITGDVSQADGIFNNSMEFDGNGDYIDVATIIPNEGTIEFWFNPHFEGDTASQIVLIDARDSLRWWTIGLGGNFGAHQLTFSCEDASDTDYFAKFDINGYVSSNNWYHAAASWKIGEPMKLYVDGDLKDSSNNLVSFDIDDRMNTLRMGYALTPSYAWPPVGYLDGLLDEVRIYNKALSSAEIQQHYVQGAVKHNIVLK